MKCDLRDFNFRQKGVSLATNRAFSFVLPVAIRVATIIHASICSQTNEPAFKVHLTRRRYASLCSDTEQNGKKVSRRG